MRRIVCVAVVVSAVWLISGATAQARDYPWCAWYDRDTYNCGFVTIGQCLATVSGAGGICRPNVWYSGPEPRRPPRRHS